MDGMGDGECLEGGGLGGAWGQLLTLDITQEWDLTSLPGYVKCQELTPIAYVKCQELTPIVAWICQVSRADPNR